MSSPLFIFGGWGTVVSGVLLFRCIVYLHLVQIQGCLPAGPGISLSTPSITHLCFSAPFLGPGKHHAAPLPAPPLLWCVHWSTVVKVDFIMSAPSVSDLNHMCFFLPWCCKETCLDLPTVLIHGYAWCLGNAYMIRRHQARTSRKLSIGPRQLWNLVCWKWQGLDGHQRTLPGSSASVSLQIVLQVFSGAFR